MNAHLKKLLQNLFVLIMLPTLGWYITRGSTVDVVDTEKHPPQRSRHRLAV